MKNDIVHLRIQEVLKTKDIYLDLSNLELTSIPTDVFQLQWLEVLNLNNNFITNLSSISQLTNIRLIDIRNNKIAHLEKDVLDIGLPVKWEFDYQNKGIYLFGNPITNPPIEILLHGENAVKSYFNALSTIIDHKTKLNNSKIIVLGDGGVGKTSLVQLLLDKDRDLRFDEPTTHGININTTRILSDDPNVSTKIWDFGGQEIMHATHQFFLTSNALYILVVDARRENGNTEYWLNTIKTFVGEVPVIIVINKIDEWPYSLMDENYLKKKYSNIVSFNKTSCLTKEGISDLFEIIKWRLSEYLFSQPTIPEKWLLVKKRMESLSRDFINYSEYKRICQEFSITDDSEQNSLSDFLNDLGVIIHFKNLSLFSTQILNPTWIAKAASLIITSKSVNNGNGRIDINSIYSIFSEYKNTYPKETYKFIIDLMVEYEMLFEIEKDLFLIPQLLPNNEPETGVNPNEELVFYFSYYFLPSNLFSRIQIRILKYTSCEFIWRNGITISQKETYAKIILDKYDRRIKIQCSGSERKELLFILREMIEKINQSYIQLSTTEFIGLGEKEIELNYLKLLQKENESDTYLPSLEKKVDINKVIADFEPQNKNELSPLKIFISYSHLDILYKKELLSHLSPLIRLNEIAIWEDSQLTPGQEWNRDIMIKLRESDLILCLISSDFISSEFCYSIELKEALDSHSRNEKVVVPVLIRKCYWEKLPIARIQGLPDPPISLQKNVDEGWVEVVKGVDKSLNMIRIKKYGT